MYNNDIELYRDLIKHFEEAINECTGVSDIQYYKSQIKYLQNKIMDLEGN
jgi:hypothetical protein